MVPDLTGWMAIFFPFGPPAEGTDPMIEASFVCPQDASKVASMIQHFKAMP